MPFTSLLGRMETLRIERLAPHGAYLTFADPGTEGAPTILLPVKDLPDGAAIGDALEVFVYRDSDDRPIATRAIPKVELGEVAFLEVTSLAPFGAFFDWGLVKELLVPFKEQTRDLVVGERHPIGLYLDESGRLAGTMKISELLKDTGAFAADEWVEGEAWRREPGLGIFVILERAFVGLLPESEPSTLARGDAARFRVSNVLPDGKIELSLRRHAHEEVDDDARKILAAMQREGAVAVSDHASPEDIRARFGLSKKAFKRATGRLFASGAIARDASGSWTPKRDTKR